MNTTHILMALAAGLCIYGAAYLLKRHKQKKLQATLQKAAQGDAQALYEAALLYYRGEKLPQDLHRAFTYMQQAARANHAKALNALGALYHAGHGTAKDVEKAFECYQKSAENGDFEGMINLAVMYRQAIGTKQDND